MKRALNSLLVLVSLLTNFLSFVSPVSAQQIGEEWSKIDDKHCVYDDVAQLGGIICLFQNTLRIILPFIGLAFFIMVIWGGYKLLTSGGDPKGAEGGKQTITLAVGGVALAILAWFILRLISEFTGINLMQFDIPTLK